jgi:hypothetical protein
MIEKFEKFELKRPEYKIEVIKKLDKETLEKILEVEKASFPKQMQSDLEDLRQTLENKKGVQIVVKNEKEKLSLIFLQNP